MVRSRRTGTPSAHRRRPSPSCAPCAGVIGGSALLMAVPWLVTSPSALVFWPTLRTAMRVRTTPALMSCLAFVLLVALSAMLMIRLDLGGAAFPLWAALIPLFALCVPFTVGACLMCTVDAWLFVRALVRTTGQVRPLLPPSALQHPLRPDPLAPTFQQWNKSRCVSMLGIIGATVVLTVPLASQDSDPAPWLLVLSPYVILAVCGTPPLPPSLWSDQPPRSARRPRSAWGSASGADPALFAGCGTGSSP